MQSRKDFDVFKHADVLLNIIVEKAKKMENEPDLEIDYYQDNERMLKAYNTHHVEIDNKSHCTEHKISREQFYAAGQLIEHACRMVNDRQKILNINCRQSINELVLSASYSQQYAMRSRKLSASISKVPFDDMRHKIANMCSLLFSKDWKDAENDQCAYTFKTQEDRLEADSYLRAIAQSCKDLITREDEEFRPGFDLEIRGTFDFKNPFVLKILKSKLEEARKLLTLCQPEKELKSSDAAIKQKLSNASLISDSKEMDKVVPVASTSKKRKHAEDKAENRKKPCLETDHPEKISKPSGPPGGLALN